MSKIEVFHENVFFFLELSGGPLGHKYKLEQFHCHWGCTSSKGSEHTVDGMPYAGEVSGFQASKNFFPFYMNALNTSLKSANI